MEYMSTIQGGIDELKPSLFELLSEQQLSALLPPTLRYLLAVATHRHPRYLIRILNNFDEAYALLSLVIERHFLKTYGGGFTENFYGLKRERVLRVRGGEIHRAQLGAPEQVRETLKLRERDVWMNLAVMIGIPYLKRKLDEGYDVHVPAAQATMLGAGFARQQTLPPDATLMQRFTHYYKWFLRHVYPSVNATYYIAMLAFNLAYLFDGSKFHNPFLWLIGTRIRRLGEADHRAIALATEGPKTSGARPGQGGSMFNPRVFAREIIPKLLSSLKILLPTSIFALKFLEWWHASDFARQLSKKANEGLELPPPVVSGWVDKMKEKQRAARTVNSSEKTTVHKAPISATTGLPIFTVPQLEDDRSELCPICLEPIQTATASPYGYVYCYQCIHRWVEGMTERQKLFMEGSEEEAIWAEEAQEGEDNVTGGSREGRWESGLGRCAVSGRRILGGTEGLRRVVV